jgi:hypothetical protein
MTRTPISLPQQRSLGQTSRSDAWWIQPLLTFLGLGAFVVYATWRAFAGTHFEHGSLLSPMYSPLLWDSPHWKDAAGNVIGSHHSWFGAWPSWLPTAIAFVPLTPAFLVLWAPGGFRFTCYYYRGAYYKAFWADPPSCAVGEPRKKYLGENSFPLIVQNLHRYMFYFALVFIIVLFIDFLKACFWGEPGHQEFGIHVGTLVMLVNVILLGGYTLGCHSFRHLVGGGLDLLARRPIRKKTYDCVSCLNRRHMLWAWMSLFWVAGTDLYVMLCSRGVINDVVLIGA